VQLDNIDAVSLGPWMETTKYWLQRLFDLSPMMIVIAVVGSLLAAFSLSIYGFFRVVNVIWDVVTNHELSEHQEEALSIELIELIDVFLISVILLIVALGLYQLFIDSSNNWPPALRVRTLDELKHKIIGVLCVILGVNFVSNVSEWSGGHDILYLGVAIALVLAALVLLLKAVDGTIVEEVKMQREESSEEVDRATQGIE
jgi:uncharacterized membrane protein YqhA